MWWNRAAIDVSHHYITPGQLLRQDWWWGAREAVNRAGHALHCLAAHEKILG